MAVRTRAMRALSICVLALAMAATAQAQTPQEAFARAMAQRERGDLHEAIQSFQAILSEHPGLNRARLELAVAYYHFLDHPAALEHARRVLNDPATPSAVRDNVRRLIAQIEADAKPHSFSAFGSAGLLYDSNVSAGPASPSYEIGNTLLALDPNAIKRSDTAASLTVGGSHRYLTQVRPRLGSRQGALLWQSQAILHRLDYFDEKAFTLQVLTLTTGPAWISPPRLRASAPLQFDRLELGGEHYLDIAGLSPAVSFGGPAGTELQLDAQVQERDYKRSIDAGRDSSFRGIGVQVGRVLAGMTVQAGARRYRDDADAGPFDNRGTEWFALVARQFGERISAYARYTYQTTRYDERDPLALTDRRDREQRLALGASYRLGAAADYPWSASLSFLDTRHRSDIPFFAFTRRQAGATLTRSF